MSLVLLAVLPACGAAKALTNPAAAKSLNEPAPMGVVLRRAEVSRKVADQVDRLISETPIDASVRAAIVLDAGMAKERMNRAGQDAIYAGMSVRVLAAEARFSAMNSACGGGTGKTLIAMLGADVASRYEQVATEIERIAKLNAEKEELEQKAGRDGTSEADKADFEAKAEQIAAQIEKIEAGSTAARERLIARIKAAAAGASAADKASMSPIVLSLLHAAREAAAANSGAVVRYPFVVSSLTTDLQQAAKRFMADIIEEQVGVRPNLGGFQPQVGFENGKVELGLNGVPVEKLGDIDAARLAADTTVRTQHYAVFALGLLAYASETEERLEFQQDLFEAWAEGLNATDASAPGNADLDSLAVVAGQAAAPAGSGARRDPESPTGLSLAACRVPEKDGAPTVVAAEAPASSDSEPVASAPPSKGEPTASPHQPVEHDTARTAASGGSGKTLGYVLGGVGIAGVVTGTVAMVLGVQQQRVGDDNCSDAARLCNQEGFDANQSAATLATVSTIGFIVGAAGLGAGTYLVLTSGSPATTAQSAGAPSLSLVRTW